MIEIFATYYLIGAIIGLIFWIWDVLVPIPESPLTVQLVILIIMAWPLAIILCIKAWIKCFRRNHNDKS